MIELNTTQAYFPLETFVYSLILVFGLVLEYIIIKLFIKNMKSYSLIFGVLTANVITALLGLLALMLIYA